MHIEGCIRVGDLEVKTYRDARGLVTAELYYKGVAQTKLSKNMMNLMAMAIETLEG
jgi:hypothetical protein